MVTEHRSAVSACTMSETVLFEDAHVHGAHRVVGGSSGVRWRARAPPGSGRTRGSRCGVPPRLSRWPLGETSLTAYPVPTSTLTAPSVAVVQGDGAGGREARAAGEPVRHQALFHEALRGGLEAANIISRSQESAALARGLALSSSATAAMALRRMCQALASGLKGNHRSIWRSSRMRRTRDVLARIGQVHAGSVHQPHLAARAVEHVAGAPGRDGDGLDAGIVLLPVADDGVLRAREVDHLLAARDEELVALAVLNAGIVAIGRDDLDVEPAQLVELDGLELAHPLDFLEGLGGLREDHAGDRGRSACCRSRPGARNTRAARGSRPCGCRRSPPGPPRCPWAGCRTRPRCPSPPGSCPW